MKKTYIAPVVSLTSSAIESQLCSATITEIPEGGRKSVFGFEGDHGNADWINEGFKTPTDVNNTKDEDDFDSQAKQSAIWDEW